MVTPSNSQLLAQKLHETSLSQEKTGSGVEVGYEKCKNEKFGKFFSSNNPFFAFQIPILDQIKGF